MTLRDKVLEAVRELRELCARATPGPWQIGDDAYKVLAPRHATEEYPLLEVDFYEKSTGAATARLIARSRTLLPALLEVAEKQLLEHAPDYSSGLQKFVCKGCYRGSAVSIVDADCCRFVLAWASALGVSQ